MLSLSWYLLCLLRGQLHGTGKDPFSNKVTLPGAGPKDVSIFLDSSLDTEHAPEVNLGTLTPVVRSHDHALPHPVSIKSLDHRTFSKRTASKNQLITRSITSKAHVSQIKV